MEFQRGYKSVRDRLDKSAKYSMSCGNCKHYFQASGDKEEMCQNNGVLEYDYIVDGNRIYCLQWERG